MASSSWLVRSLTRLLRAPSARLLANEAGAASPYDPAWEATRCRICCHQLVEAITSPLRLHFLTGEGTRLLGRRGYGMGDDGVTPSWENAASSRTSCFPGEEFSSCVVTRLWRVFRYLLGSPASINSQQKVLGPAASLLPQLPNPCPRDEDPPTPRHGDGGESGTELVPCKVSTLPGHSRRPCIAIFLLM